MNAERPTSGDAASSTPARGTPPGRRRAVLTGIGIINPIGKTTASFWESLRSGKSGIRTLQSFDPAGLPTRFGGEVADFDPKKILHKDHRKSLKTMARSIQLAVAGAQLGALLSHKIKGKSIIRALAVCLAIVGIRILLSAV